MQKRHAWFPKSAFYPKPDGPIKLQPSALHKLRDFPTGDDTDAEGAVRAKFEKFAMPQLQPISSRNPQTQMWVSSRITTGRPSPRWQQDPVDY